MHYFEVLSTYCRFSNTEIFLTDKKDFENGSSPFYNASLQDFIRVNDD